MANKPSFKVTPVVKFSPPPPFPDRPATHGAHGQKNPDVSTYHGTGENPQTTGPDQPGSLQKSTEAKP